MMSAKRWSRRALLKLLKPALLTPLLGREFSPAGTLYGATNEAARVAYRADAVILLFGLSIFSKAGVGSGFAFVEEGTTPGMRRYGFGGGSWPDRAHGLNRLGYLHENVVEENGRCESARYFGFMTSSQEEKLDEAREAMKKGAAENVFSAIQGESRRGAYSARFTRFQAESGGWRLWRRIAAAAERSFAGDCLSRREERGAPRDPASTLPTLLYSLARLRESGLRNARTVFVYGGVPREMEMNVANDARMGERFRQRGLVKRAGMVVQMTGVTRNLQTGAKTRFHVWWDRDQATPLPLRIKMEPKSFLRLAFEADPAVNV
jgi:hypothetical protein